MVSIYVITGTKIQETGYISFKFMFDSEAPYDEFCSIASNWGVVTLGRKSEDYVDPFKLVKNEPGAIGDDGIKRWSVRVGNSDRQIFSAGCNESPDELGLKDLLNSNFPNCVLLMEQCLYERFEKVCLGSEIEIKSYHYDGILTTS